MFYWAEGFVIKTDMSQAEKDFGLYVMEQMKFSIFSFE